MATIGEILQSRMTPPPRVALTDDERAYQYGMRYRCVLTTRTGKTFTAYGPDASRAKESAMHFADDALDGKINFPSCRYATYRLRPAI